jgi:hypothetical protein
MGDRLRSRTTLESLEDRPALAVADRRDDYQLRTSDFLWSRVRTACHAFAMGGAAAAWAGAIATSLAVVVALFGPGFERWRRRPKLTLSAYPPAELGTAAKVVGGDTEDGAVTYWLRLPILNSGRSTAEDVRAFFLRIEGPTQINKQPPSRELKWADVIFDRGTLPPRVSRLIDIVHVTTAPDSAGRTRRGVVAGVMPLSSADRGYPDSLLWRDMASGRYQVHVSVSAKDIAAVRYIITFILDANGAFDANAVNLETASVHKAA